ncbi:hypothetical protein [Actinokineospora inagensis]|uniref:hypothetical protein n=1 Tax=Actinokineospora inagensis TaxID=103730 RepID=UPI0003F523DD|nr:hypothetical protein [Actinokineospora inagensis]
MIAEEQDRAASRLRDELGAVCVRTRPDQVDRVLRHVHGRRRAQRHQRIQMVAALTVVAIAVAGAFVVGRRTDESAVTVASTVGDWQLRGDLAGDQALLTSAEQVWRSSANPPSGSVRPVYAGVSPNLSMCFAAVVLISAAPGGTEQVAFVTTAVSVNGKPDKGKLLLRAVTTVPAAQRAVGFLAAAPAAEDEQVTEGAAIGLALTAPGTTDVDVYTSSVNFLSPLTNVQPGVAWPAFETGAGAWNSELVLVMPNDKKERYPIAAGINDVEVGPVTIRVDNPARAVRAIGAGVRPGDVIATTQGVLGVVSDANGTIDTSLPRLAAVGKVETAISAIPGRLRDSSRGVTFEPTAAGPLADGNRLVLLAWNRPEILVNIGTIQAFGRGWLTNRAAEPTGVTTALRVSGP